MTTPEHILTVCTANICRSPVAERLLADVFGPEVRVSSAGAKAVVGAPACPEAQNWLQEQYAPGRRSRHASSPLDHAARQLTPDLVSGASLILTATRDQRATVIRLLPGAQTYTFTLAQAARIAGWQTAQGAQAPKRSADRFAWLVRTLHEGRGSAPRPDDEADDDLPDPHEHQGTHAEMLPRAYSSIATIAHLLVG